MQKILIEYFDDFNLHKEPEVIVVMTKKLYEKLKDDGEQVDRSGIIEVYKTILKCGCFIARTILKGKGFKAYE